MKENIEFALMWHKIKEKFKVGGENPFSEELKKGKGGGR